MDSIVISYRTQNDDASLREDLSVPARPPMTYLTVWMASIKLMTQSFLHCFFISNTRENTANATQGAARDFNRSYAPDQLTAPAAATATAMSQLANASRDGLEKIAGQSLMLMIAAF